MARANDDLAAQLALWGDGVGLATLASFENHAGFDGVVLGRPGASWHLELTRHRGRPVIRLPDPDDLLVLYEPDDAAWRARVARMREASFAPVSPHDPWWEGRADPFADPDGWRLVLCQESGSP